MFKHNWYKQFIKDRLGDNIGMLKNKLIYIVLKRLLDITLSSFAVIFFFVPFLIIFSLIKLSSKGSAIYLSDRIGKNNKIFSMPKFRTMYLDTPSLASHLLDKPDQYITPIGKILRKYSLDELPQIWCVFIGVMSVVGPRPALYNQNDLISLRTKNNIHTLTPGLTGLAQINGRDDLSINEKVNFDKEYFNNQSLLLDIVIIIVTIKKVFISENINH